MKYKKSRHYFRIIGAIISMPLFIPHLVMFAFTKKEGKILIAKDLEKYINNVGWPTWLKLVYILNCDRWFRNIFYYRLGPVKGILIKWIRPGDKTFFLPYHVSVGGGIYGAHPFSTDLNAEEIGDNFSFKNNTTIGCKNHKRPIIGNDVEVGVNVVIIGGIRIGNNVTIGAGAVVVKDVPDNAVVAGNPAKILYYKETKS